MERLRPYKDPMSKVLGDFLLDNASGKIWVGIDPGTTGAVGLIGESSATVASLPTLEVVRSGKKTKKGNLKKIKVFDYGEIASSFTKLKDRCNDAFVIIEKAQARGSESADAFTALRVGISYGMWPLFLTGLGIPYDDVAASSWKAVMRLWRKPKDDSRFMAMKLWPYIDLSPKYTHNCAEAMLLAEYGRRMHS